MVTTSISALTSLQPQDGSSIQSFLQWEESIISAIAADKRDQSCWAVWQANEGICITSKEQRLATYAMAKTQLEESGLEVATRRTGGTTVPHGEGIVSITHISSLSGRKDIQQAYMDFCTQIQQQLQLSGFQTTIGAAAGAYCDGDYNILLDNKKLVGTSQRWKHAGINKSIILNHAVMLISSNAEQATQRVNTFHQFAENREPYSSAATTSLWESPQNKTTDSKADFFEKIMQSLRLLT